MPILSIPSLKWGDAILPNVPIKLVTVIPKGNCIFQQTEIQTCTVTWNQSGTVVLKVLLLVSVPF